PGTGPRDLGRAPRAAPGSRRRAAVAERRTFPQRPRHAFDGLALLAAPCLQRRAEAIVGDPVPAAHRRGQEAASDLVLTLGAGLEPAQPLAQAVFDALVVAGLEVQAGQLPRGAPVAAVEGVAP